ncbi:hypothetical protein DRJ54_03640 [Candidatus Acetothermia bacterium]|nr:MAG: hypothetical protein DRJ54_03640 [Candidatus Acetothermia bacterium]
MLPDDVQERLAALGADRLAEELARLAHRSDEVYATVERLIASPEENLERFKKKLARLRRARKYYRWREAAELAQELEDMLGDLRAARPEPKQGLELLAKFYASDGRTLQRCDDSGGWVGPIFSEAAAKLFAEFAQRCEDKAWVADLVFRLFSEDDYGVRHGLLARAASYLPEEEIRKLANRLLEWARENPEQAFHYRYGAETLARELKDPRLFERAALASHHPPAPGVHLQIAQVYLETGEPEEALEGLQRAQPRWDENEYDSLLYRAYEQLGEQEKLAEVAWRMFTRNRSLDTLESLLRVIGEDQRETVIEKQVKEILNSPEFSYEDASFLVQVGRLAEAEEYLLRHREKLNGDLYSILLPWAKALERGGHPLGATVVYRALLESILNRAITKYYHHGVRYLKKLETLAERIRDWKGMAPHGEYLAGLRETHKRKRSFWGKYEGKR